MAEVYKCERLNFEVDAALKTFQVEGCKDVSVVFSSRDHFQTVIFAGTRNLSVSFKDHEDAVETGFDRMRDLAPEEERAALREDIDQWIIQYAGDELLTEKIIRLPNGFPSTERQHAAWLRTQEKNYKAFAANAGMRFVSKTPQVGKTAKQRNAICDCGSGKKYKNCCLEKDQAEEADALPK